MAAASLGVVAALALASSPAQALRAHRFSTSFGSSGSGSGQFSGPAGVAVSEASGDVYVVDAGNNRVEHFDSTGSTVLGEFNGSAAPTGAFAAPEAIAVDNSTNPLDPSAGDVYVADTGHSVIDKFSASGTYLGQLTSGSEGEPFGTIDGVAVDPEGVVWVYQSSGEIDSYSDGLENEFLSARTFALGTFTSPGLAVDSEDNLYVNDGFHNVVKVNSEGELLSVVEEEETTGVAVDQSSNDVYLDNVASVAMFSSEGALRERFGAGALSGGSGIAVNSTSGTVYVAESSGDAVQIFDVVVLPDVGVEPVSALTPSSVTLNGTVNTDEEGEATCSFEYGTSTAYGQSAACSEAVPSGNTPAPVSASVTGLQPDTVYHYRLDATNANGTNKGPDEQFKTSGPGIHSESVASVTSESAKLQAQIDPNNADTHYYFQYGTDTSYNNELPAPPGVDIGSAEGDQSAGVQVTELAPGTVYHYRVVAASELVPGEPPQSFVGADRTFTTQGVGGPALPDGRAWELVSPPSKGGATIEAIAREGGLIQAAADGGAITYAANAPIEAAPPGNPALEPTQVLSTRGPGGWLSKDIATPHEAALGHRAGYGDEYRFFSPSLSLGLVEPLGETPLSPDTTEKTIYERDSASGAFTPLVTAANVPAGTKFRGGIGTEIFAPEFVSATPDLSHVVLRSVAPLTAGAGEGDLYEWVGGQLRLVSVLPGGELPSGSPVLGDRGFDVRNALSADGSRVVFSEAGGEGHLYMYDATSDKSVLIDAVQPGAEGGVVEPRFQTASSDGAHIFFTDSQRLTVDATTGGEHSPDLYEFNADSGQLTDLTVDATPGEHAEVQGLALGASEDGSFVYLVAKGVLTSVANAAAEKATAGAPNLYELHNGGAGWEAPRFVATLAGEDRPDWNGEGGSEESNLTHLAARVSPNGRYLAFMSQRSLTGYDNLDSGSGQPDEEVFLYDEHAQRLTCASCNPTGARPAGVFDSGEFPGLLIDRPENWGAHWLAGSIPGWTSIDLVRALYQSRYLSDSGRLFFNSPDALVPQDENGKRDVYEYEPNGEGGCHDAGGCVGLISSGASGEESAFLDASLSGNDAFFLTASRLSGADFDASLDVYDARVCAASDPCLASTGASAPAPCTSGETCKAPPAQQPTIFGDPPSATFAGSGNLTPPPPSKAKP